MKVLKTIFKLLLLVALSVYLGFTFFHLSKRKDSGVCTTVKLAIEDSLRAGFISEKEAVQMLKTANLYPLGAMMDTINSAKIEEHLEKSPYIKDVVCYKSPSGRVNIIVNQRVPIMRVIASNGENYYIDESGFTMVPGKYIADQIIATGNIDKQFSQKFLLKIGQQIKENKFWENQIEQINITEDKKVEMIPRVGNQLIYLGSPINVDKKLDNLETFYKKVMPTVGWNKYSKINLEFENQIICTKNKK